MDEKVHVLERKTYTPYTDTMEGMPHLDCENIEMLDNVAQFHALKSREEGNEIKHIFAYQNRRRKKSKRKPSY